MFTYLSGFDRNSTENTPWLNTTCHSQLTEGHLSNVSQVTLHLCWGWGRSMNSWVWIPSAHKENWVWKCVPIILVLDGADRLIWDSQAAGQPRVMSAKVNGTNQGTPNLTSGLHMHIDVHALTYTCAYTHTPWKMFMLARLSDLQLSPSYMRSLGKRIIWTAFEGKKKNKKLARQHVTVNHRFSESFFRRITNLSRLKIKLNMAGMQLSDPKFNPMYHQNLIHYSRKFYLRN